MSLSSADPMNAQEVRGYLDKILNSATFRKGPSLRRFLEYVVTESAEGRAHQIKESVIAIQVFGRRVSFDGRTDNIVRVQAHRLRKLLELYYSEEGKNDKVLLSIPKGSYVPQFIFHDDGELVAHVEIPAPMLADNIVVVPSRDFHPLHSPEHILNLSPRHRTFMAYAAIFLAGVLLAILASRALGHSRQPQHGPAPAVAELWKGIFEPGVKTLVSYTNPVFLRVGHSAAYLLYNGPLSAPSGTEIQVAENDPYGAKQFMGKGESLYFSDGWTGTGEVLAMNRVTVLATQFDQALSVVPSRALALNEMHGANVIFLGSPWGNGALSQIGTYTSPFYITNSGSIVVRQPASGERASYANLQDETTKQTKTCYALFSVLPGIDDGRKVVSSAGIGTQATWAGIDFVTTASGAFQLARALKKANAGKLPPFYQAVIQAQIIKGSISGQSLIAARVVKP